MNGIMSPAGSTQGMSGDQAALAALPEESAVKALIEHLMGSNVEPGMIIHHLIPLSRNAAALCMDLIDNAKTTMLTRSVSDAVIAN